MANKIEVKCGNCGKTFSRRKAEYNRSERLGKRHFCGRTCAAINRNKEYPKERLRKESRIKEHSGNMRDEYTPFRYFIKVINIKNRSNKKGNVNLEYIKELWENQKGICPLTGWELDLPYSVMGWKTLQKRRRASIDRIDNSKGYIKGNVRFVSYMANIARNNMSDEDVIEFCRAVTKNNE